LMRVRHHTVDWDVSQPRAVCVTAGASTGHICGDQSPKSFTESAESSHD
jgi:hypothetical protein